MILNAPSASIFAYVGRVRPAADIVSKDSVLRDFYRDGVVTVEDAGCLGFDLPAGSENLGMTCC